MIDHLLSEPVTIQHRDLSGIDVYGSTTTTTTTSTATVGYLERRSAVETVAGRQQTVSQWLLVLPAGTAVDATDRVVARGLTFEVDGPPDVRTRPGGTAHHVEVELRAVSTGAGA